MRVYRCIKFQEIITKYKNEKKIIDNSNNQKNTHEYEKNKEYIHFFRYEDFAIHYFNLKTSDTIDKKKSDFIFFMVANIPDDILEKYLGFGFYNYRGEEIAMPEYAIPADEFLPDYVVDMTTYPIGDFGRKNESEEFKRYLILFNKLKSTNMSTKEIANFLLKNNFEKLLGFEVDKRNELEIEQDINNLISMKNFLNEDSVIEEFRK